MSENSPECSISAWLVVRRLSVVRRCKRQSAVFSALAAASWPISVLPTIVASVIAPVNARAGLGVDRSASLIGVTNAASEGV
jgi:hypothetical protein